MSKIRANSANNTSSPVLRLGQCLEEFKKAERYISHFPSVLAVALPRAKCLISCE